MITINFRNGEIHKWKPDGYTDYEYRDDMFIVKYENQWVGIYNWRDIVSVEVQRKKAEDWNGLDWNIEPPLL